MPGMKIHRLVVLGAERVGKTAIIEQLVFGNHVIGQGGSPTIGDIYEVCIETEKGTVEKLQIFDTPGSLFTTSKGFSYEQEHFLSIADGFLLVYEITSKSSLDLVFSLRLKIITKSKDVPMVVLGNKSDLNAIRQVDFAKVQLRCRMNATKAYEVSVLDKDAIKEPFCYIAWRLMNPGRQFPQLSALSSASLRPHPSQQQPTQAQLPTMAAQTGHSEAAYPVERPGSTDKPAAGGSGGLPTTAFDDTTDCPHPGSVRQCPDDAMFPKKAGLFFADCMSHKNKPPPNDST